MLRNFFKAIGGMGLYLLAFLIPLMIIVFWGWRNYAAPLDRGSEEKIFFQVESGWTTSQIAEELKKQGVIRNSSAISFITNYRMSDEERDDMKITAGEYQLSPAMTPSEVLASLISGKVVLYELQIPPGANINEIAQLVQQHELMSADLMLSSMKDNQLLARLGIPSFTPEGYLIEGTYEFTKTDDPQELIGRLLKQAEEKLAEAIPNWKEQAKKLDFRPYDILTLASLVEKQTDNIDERPLVASVLHNRLRIGMPLQNDAALMYGDPTLSQLGEIDRKTPGPYNTYLNTGLPQTPICSPSISSIKAALEPGDSDFLYMAAKGDGSHDFSATLKEHKKKEKQYLDAILGEQ